MCYGDVENFHVWITSWVTLHTTNNAYDTRPATQVRLVAPIMVNNHEEWFVYKGTKLWNLVPEDIRNISSPSEAKKGIKLLCKQFNYYL